jgi:hypothetical protein
MNQFSVGDVVFHIGFHVGLDLSDNKNPSPIGIVTEILNRGPKRLPGYNIHWSNPNMATGPYFTEELRVIE